jgi:hypothetical protein
MDILSSLVLFLWFILALFMLGAALFFERDNWNKADILVVIVLFVVCLAFILNNYLGNEVIEGVVFAVSKTASDGTVKVEISDTVSTEFESSNEILRSYEVAIYPTGSNQLQILTNDNNLWRLKFNKRAIQLQLEPGKKYRFIVHRLFFGKNILDIEVVP